MNRLIAVAAIVAVVVGGIIVWVRSKPAPLYLQSHVVAQGQGLYAEYCASCHGANLEGEPDWRDRDADGFLPAPPHDATGHTWHHPDAQLLTITLLGTSAVVGNGYPSRMPGFGEDLTKEQILSILAYIKSTWPPEIIERHNEINKAG